MTNVEEVSQQEVSEPTYSVPLTVDELFEVMEMLLRRSTSGKLKSVGSANESPF